MRTEEVKTQTWLPLADRKTEDKIYVHLDSDHKVNMGPLMDFFHFWGKDYKEGVDIHFQRVLKFMGECMGAISIDGSEDNRYIQDQYLDCLWFMHSLKDAMYLLEEPYPYRDFIKLSISGQMKYLEGALKINKKDRKLQEKMEKEGAFINVALKQAKAAPEVVNEVSKSDTPT